MYKIDVKIMLTSNIHSLSSTGLILVFTKQSASLIVLLKFLQTDDVSLKFSLKLKLLCHYLIG